MIPIKKGKQFSQKAVSLLLLFYGGIMGALAEVPSLKAADTLFAQEQYAASITVYQQLLRSSRSTTPDYLYWKIARSWRRLDHDSMRVALEAAETAWRSRGETEDTVAAMIANEWGNFYIDEAAVMEAKTYFEKAYQIRQAVRPPNHPTIMASLNNLGQIAYFLDEDQEADRYYRMALAIARQNPKVPRRWQGLLLQGIANNYDYLGQTDSALLYFERALEQFERAFPNQLHTYTVNNQLRLAEAWSEKGNYAKAIALLRPLLQIPADSVAEAVQQRLPRVLIALGDLCVEAQDFRRAEDAYLRATDWFGQHPPERVALRGHLLNRQGAVAQGLGQDEIARQYFRRALQPQYELNKNARRQILLNLTRLYLATDADSAQDWWRQIDPLSMPRRQAIQWELLGALVKKENPVVAYQKALNQQIDLLGPQHPEHAQLGRKLSQHYLRMGDTLAAIRSIETAMNANRVDGQVLSLPVQIRLLEDMGKISLAFRMWNQALNVYLQTDSLLDELLRLYPGEETKLLLRNELSHFYGSALFALGEADRSPAERQQLAIHFSERNRSFLLRSRMQELEQLQAGQLTPLQDQLSGAQNQLSWIRNRYFAAESDSLRQGYQVQLAAQQEMLRQLEERLKTEAPALYAQRYQLASPSPQDLQAQLSPQECLLSFTRSAQHWMVVSIGAAHIELYALPFAAEQESELATFIRSLADIDAYYARPEAVMQQFRESAHLWYQRLLQPVLANLSPETSLTMLPDGILGYLPFEVLLTEPTEGEDFRTLPYLFQRHPLRYAYTLPTTTIRPPETVLSYLGFAPSYANQLASAARSEGLKDLPWARKEVEEAGRLFGGKTKIGSTATEATLWEWQKPPAILHLSMHALLDDTDPLHSRLLFSGDELGEGLQVHEIYQLPFASQLVVLSACNTGLGPIQRGEGIMSLARAFRYAGFPSMLTSLWLVDDASAYQIHQSYFERLAAGKQKALALQGARQDFLQSTDKFNAHPFYWASLVQWGTDEPIQFPPKRDWIWMGLLCLLGGLLLGYRFRSRNRT